MLLRIQDKVDDRLCYEKIRESGFYEHKTVNHGKGGYTRDDDGKCEAHVDTMEGFWPLLRPHRAGRYMGFGSLPKFTHPAHF